MFKSKNGSPLRSDGVANMSQQQLEGFKEGLKKRVENHKESIERHTVGIRTDKRHITALEGRIQFLEEGVVWVEDELMAV